MIIPSPEELNLLHNNICTALADTTRIQILYALHEQPRNVTTLAEILHIPQPTASRHLRILRQRELVATEREGSSVIYRLSEPRIINVINEMRSILRDKLTRQTNIFATVLDTP